LDWIEQNWNEEVLGLEAKTGVGKTAMIRAIQSSFPEGSVDVISYSNQLVDDYSEVYGLNSVKGRDHYDTDEEYIGARRRAWRGEDTIYNPYSWIYSSLQSGGRRPDIIIFDEAHKLMEMLYQYAIISVPVASLADKQYLHDRRPNDFEVQAVLREEIELLEKSDKLENQLRGTHYRSIQDDLLEHPEFYVVSTKSYRRKHYLEISPIKPPKHLIKQLFPAGKYIVLSATMPPYTFREMFKDGKYKSMPHPVDPENRQVVHYTVHEEDRKDFSVLGPMIDNILVREGMPNTIIHCTYEDAKILSRHMKTPVIMYSKTRKKDVVDLFKREGGILMGCGLAEGVSFEDEKCNLQIIPVMPNASLLDRFIRTRRACQDGQFWYNLKTMLTFWQMVGRGCRHENDFCRTYVLDPLFAPLVNATKTQFGKSLTDSIIWNYNVIGDTDSETAN